MRILVVITALLLAACSTPPPGTGPPASSATAAQQVMPDLVGTSLQQAQDQMQRLTGNNLFITLSHDASGRKREQVDDDNWRVCTQNIPPGAPVTRDSKIDFGVVKSGETCP